MRNFLLKIEYDGSRFIGYQKQPYGRTVQQDIEIALFKLFKKQIKVSAAGRTDRGVHAEGQCINFSVDTFLSEEKIYNFLNRILEDIRATSICEVDLNFNSRLFADRRRYIYRIRLSKDRSCFSARYYHFVDKIDPNIELLLKKFIGIHDFKYYSSKIEKSSFTEREILSINCSYGEGLDIEIEGRSFLRGMIRIMVGTVFAILDGRLPKDFIEKSLNNPYVKERKNKAPAEGLYLNSVEY